LNVNYDVTAVNKMSGFSRCK